MLILFAVVFKCNSHTHTHAHTQRLPELRPAAAHLLRALCNGIFAALPGFWTRIETLAAMLSSAGHTQDTGYGSLRKPGQMAKWANGCVDCLALNAACVYGLAIKFPVQ